MNNLKDVSVVIPKRRLTVFTGVSGSGKSSLVFGTIAAESQRLINETYSAFVQGFMPTLARPEVDVLDGLTTAIIVDQERLGANVRSTVGTVTDANAMLRILFSRLGEPHIGPPNAYSFNVPSVRASGAITVERGTKKTVKATFNRLGGMCPRCEGMGSISDFDLTALYDDSKSLNEGAITIPGYSMEGWYGRIFRGCGFFDPDKPISKFTKKELHDLLHKEATKIKVEGINLTYLGLIPQIQKSFLSKDVDALQPHIRAFVERAVVFSTCPECDGTRLAAEARSSKIDGKNIADACAMQISDLAEWLKGMDEPSVKPLLAALQHTFDSFVEIGLGYLSLERPSGTLSGGEAQRTKMIRHLGSSLTDVTYVFDEPTIGLHPHDIARMNDLLLQLRDKGNTVLVVEHKPEAIAIADHVVDLGPHAGTAGGEVVLRGHHRRAPRQRHPHRAAPRRPCLAEAFGAHTVGHAGGPRRRHPQPPERRRRHPPRGAGRRDRGRRLGEELADPRFGRRPRRRRRHRPSRDPRFATQQPGDLHRPAGTDPQGLRQSQRRQAGAVLGQLGRRVPDLQRQRCDLHRSGDDGRCLVHVRRLRRQAVRRVGARLPPRRPRHQRGPRHAGHRSRAVLRPTAKPARPLRTRSSSGSWMSGWATSPSANRSPRCRVANGKGSSSPRTWATRAAPTSSTNPPPASTSPMSNSSSGCSTSSSTPARPSSSSSTTKRSWPMPTGSSTSAPVPATTAARSSSKAPPPTSPPSPQRSPANTSLTYIGN